MVLVPFTSRMPCASLPSSFASEVLQVSRYFSFYMRSWYSIACPVSSSITAPAKNFWYAHSFSCRFVLARPSPFFVFLLLIVKSGMDAVSFAAKHAMRPSCLSCADNLLLLLTWFLEDVSGSMTVLLVFDTWTLLGGSFYFLFSQKYLSEELYCN